MVYLMYGIAIVLFITAAIYSVLILIDGSFAARCISMTFWIVTFASFCYVMVELDDKGPCVEYETLMLYNPAVKVTMPARVCVERSEWVE